MKALQAIIMLAVVLNSFRMGLAFEYRLEPRKNAKFLIIRMLTQFLMIPGLVMLVVWLFRDLVTPYQKMSILCLGCCPGGVASTAFAGRLGADTEKATRISAFTVVFSWLFTPALFLLLSLYIDYDSPLFTNHLRTFVSVLAACVTFALVPLVLGGLLRGQVFNDDSRQVALTRLQRILFLLEILTTLATVFLVMPIAKKFTTRYIVAIGVYLPFLTAAFGLLFATICHWVMLRFCGCCLPEKTDPIEEYKTFALTAGIQNNRLAMAILVAWSFWNIEDFYCAKAFVHVNIGPALYGLSQLLTCGLAVLVKQMGARNRLAQNPVEKEALQS